MICRFRWIGLLGLATLVLLRLNGEGRLAESLWAEIYKSAWAGIFKVLGIVNFRYEGGLTLQDTTYPTTSPFFLPYRQAFGVADLGVVAPIWKGATVHAGVKNVLDRNYYYNAGFPEAGRNWFLNFRYSF
jgi:outer membrane receptor protein involved in Fe transport